LATYAHKLDKQQAAIDWRQDAAQLARQIRAFNAWPVAYSELQGTRIRIWQATACDQATTQPPGTIIRSHAQGIEVACGSGTTLRLATVQLPGAKVLPVSEVLKAKSELFAAGARFSEQP